MLRPEQAPARRPAAFPDRLRPLPEQAHPKLVQRRAALPEQAPELVPEQVQVQPPAEPPAGPLERLLEVLWELVRV